MHFSKCYNSLIYFLVYHSYVCSLLFTYLLYNQYCSGNHATMFVVVLYLLVHKLSLSLQKQECCVTHNSLCLLFAPQLAIYFRAWNTRYFSSFTSYWYHKLFACTLCIEYLLVSFATAAINIPLFTT